MLPTLKAFARRFLARGSNAGHLSDLLAGYWLSFGLFLVAVAVALAMLGWQWRRLGDAGKWPRTVVLLLLAATVPLLENLLLLQHATQFSFDRLKFVVPAALVIGLAFASLGRRARLAYAALLLVAAWQGAQSYRIIVSISPATRVGARWTSRTTNCSTLPNSGWT